MYLPTSLSGGAERTGGGGGGSSSGGVNGISIDLRSSLGERTETDKSGASLDSCFAKSLEMASSSGGGPQSFKCCGTSQSPIINELVRTAHWIHILQMLYLEVASREWPIQVQIRKHRSVGYSYRS